MKLDSIPTNTEISVSIGPVGPITANTLKFEQFEVYCLTVCQKLLPGLQKVQLLFRRVCAAVWGATIDSASCGAWGHISLSLFFKLIGVRYASINGHTLRVYLSRYCYIALNVLNIILAQGTLVISCNKKYYVK